MKHVRHTRRKKYKITTEHMKEKNKRKKKENQKLLPFNGVLLAIVVYSFIFLFLSFYFFFISFLLLLQTILQYKILLNFALAPAHISKTLCIRIILHINVRTSRHPYNFFLFHTVVYTLALRSYYSNFLWLKESARTINVRYSLTNNNFVPVFFFYFSYHVMV